MTISFEDYAGGVEHLAIPTRTLPLVDSAAAFDYLVTPDSPTLTKITAISLTSRVQENSSFTSSCAVGAPYQGNMRQLAMDRWNYMYPS